MRNSTDLRQRRIQKLAYEIMDEMNAKKERKPTEVLTVVIDNLSRAVGDLSDPSGAYSLDYVEGKIESAHSLLFEKTKVKVN